MLLPAHAATTNEPVETNYSQTNGFENTGDDPEETMDDQTLTFRLGGVTPTGNGTVTISNLAGDLGGDSDEQWITILNGVELGRTKNSDSDCEVAPGDVFNVSLADLKAAVSGDSIVIKAENAGDIDTFCGATGGDGGESNRMDVTLAFPALG